MTATVVPMWSAVSNAFSRPGWPVKSFHRKSQGTRIRWPLDEIGRNSDSPCVIPRTMAWTMDTGGRSPESGGPCGRHDAGRPLAGRVEVVAARGAGPEGGEERSGVGEVGHLD